MSIRSLSIRGKLLAAFGLIFILILGLGGMSAIQMHFINGHTRELRDHWMPSGQALGELKLIFSRERTRAARVMGTNDPAQRRAPMAEYNQARPQIEAATKTYEQLISSPEERALLDRFRAEYRAYADLTASLLAAPPGDAAAMAAFNGESVRLFRVALESLDAASALNNTGAARAAQGAETFYQRALWLNLGAVLLAALLCAISVIGLARNVGGGVRSLSASMLRLAKRDYDFALPELTRRDEIGEMARAVETCRDGLREADALAAAQAEEAAAKAARGERVDGLLRGFEAEAAEVLRGVASAAVELNETAGEMASTAHDGVERATSVAAASEQASANVQTVAASAEELAASIAEVARQVASSADVARRAADDARQTDGAVQGLSDAARSIGDVVRLINDIAGQTNLLALNATIEAARAGEAGRGFAVVASEVKTLAAQTAKATEQIGSQIAAMQGETERAVSAIGGIVRTIEEMNSITTQVAAAAEEQSAATREIGRAVAEAASGTQDVSRHTAGVTEGAERTGAAAAQLRSASGELAHRAEQLRGRVDRFLAEIRAA
ncbi:HAMP domain-containing methyl-accepting chemotaxis protein [Roseomonas xinghualingensis]|uniref:HAMP domain-containing methyl-accepting chemotaxis protein n=1 Tax=Roseomonas xinghualingensis TaxID=2986475 RepID=UPI0021F0CD44|nr:methyl-accepting chemotaxis protein [Roseomonas sp. SXEYE001]MCV4207497.1 methyl-accepting chemotaxis protein [Roseomonas sp. SXEYE001]